MYDIEQFAGIIGGYEGRGYAPLGTTWCPTLGKLKEQEVIGQSRGQISITDAKALAAMSCECYRVLKEEYERILPPPPAGGGDLD